MGAAVAGRLVDVSSAWRALSYVIAIVLLFGVALRLVAAFVFIEAFDPFQISDIVVGLGAGILVPIWATCSRVACRASPRTPPQRADPPLPYSAPCCRSRGLTSPSSRWRISPARCRWA